MRAGQDGAIPEARGAVGAVSQGLPSLEPQPCWAQSPWEPMAGPAQQSRIGLIQQDKVAVAVPGALAGDLPLGAWSSLGLQGQEWAGAGHHHHPSRAPPPPQHCHKASPGVPVPPLPSAPQGTCREWRSPSSSCCHGPGPHCAPCCLFSLIPGYWCHKKRGQCSPQLSQGI